MNLQHIRILIGEGETTNAVKALLNLLQEGAGKNKRLRDDLLIISNQLQELKRKESMGMLDNDEARHQSAQLNSALLALIEEMEAVNPESSNITQRQETVSAEPASSANKKRQWWWWLLIPLLVVGGMLGVFREQILGDKGEKQETVPAPAPAPEATETLPLPLARFTFDNALCQAPCEVRFTNESRYADRYHWDFGDGTQATDEQPKHTYRSAGRYTVALVAIKETKRDTSFQNLQIGEKGRTVTPPVQTPKAGFRYTAPSGTAPCNIVFTNTSTHATRYQWSVNGVLSGTSSNLDHRFEQAGTYEIRLVAISANGRDSYSTTVQINPSEEYLLVGFAVDKKECEAPCQIQFINRSANADRYEWRINGQMKSSDKDFAQTFSTAGTYVILLTGYRRNESKNSERSIRITMPFPSHNVAFIPNKTECEAPCQVQFSNRSTNTDRYEWRVNGQLRSKDKDYTHTFSSSGNYIIQLTGYQGTVAKNAERTIRIPTSPPPQKELIVAFNPNKTECEAPCQAQFSNRSVNADRYEWRVNGQLKSRDKDFVQNFTTAGNYVIQLIGYQGAVAKDEKRTIRITEPKPKQSSAPLPISPAPGTVFNNFPRATTLRWRPVSQAVSYSVELDCMGCCASGKWCNDVGKKYQIKEGLSVTSYNFNWVGAQKGRWRVWAKLRDGTLTGKSEWREFDYTR